MFFKCKSWFNNFFSLGSYYKLIFNYKLFWCLKNNLNTGASKYKLYIFIVINNFTGQFLIFLFLKRND